MTTQLLKVIVKKKRERKRVVVLIQIVERCSKTSKLTCSLINQNVQVCLCCQSQQLIPSSNLLLEKCPIINCKFHLKGFARKCDKNRHTLAHYKGTMVCGFCPSSGSAAEKSFNRADVFKRHLTSVHGVEQTTPNYRKKSPPTSNAKQLK